MNRQKEKEGIVYGALSYVMWGFIPIYWKLLDGVGAGEILAHRIVWSFVFMVALLFSIRQWNGFLQYLKEIIHNKKKFWSLFAASVFVSANWGIFIWAVNAGRILDTSLGYYINPLVSIVLGVTVLKEKLSKAQVVSVFLAALGVIILTVYLGSFPWISIALALTFGMYGLAKKLINAEAAIGLTLETMMVAPFALIYCLYVFVKGDSGFFTGSNAWLMMGGGIATALPLLLFAMGAKRVPLSMMGFLQYIAPTISLLVGVWMYHEAFTKIHLVAFIFIWSALLLYSFSQVKFKSRNEHRIQKGA
ncbi:EamA family transporter RarD [Bacillus testis]|uniref:EamA family transporter RarD n=1 Tax=Bacillus testis TaxID=1622072 RepID=UPI00067EF86F|nr:EamA family transporter RarD [Bacillus testis]